MRKEKYNEEEELVEEIFKAKEALRHAQINFNNAEPKYFEIANQELTIAQMKYDVLFKKMKTLKDSFID